MNFRMQLLLSSLLLGSFGGRAQRIIELRDAARPVPYAALIDTAHKVYRSTDSNGQCILPPGQYEFIVNHVSFRSQLLVLTIPDADTLIPIELQPAASRSKKFR